MRQTFKVTIRETLDQTLFVTQEFPDDEEPSVGAIKNDALLICGSQALRTLAGYEAKVQGQRVYRIERQGDGEPLCDEISDTPPTYAESTDRDSMLRPKDYQDAIEAQRACNLPGILYTFSRVMPRIINEVREAGGGTNDWNGHPISVLYATQIAYLSGAGGVFDHDVYRVSLETCEERAQA